MALTNLHGDEFKQSYYYRMEGEAYLFRVLTYTDDLARVYYVGETGEFVLNFFRYNEVWELGSSTQIIHLGNAYEIVWPYFFRSDDGIVPFIFLTFFIVLFAVFLAPLFVRFMIWLFKHVNRTE